MYKDKYLKYKKKYIKLKKQYGSGKFRLFDFNNQERLIDDVDRIDIITYRQLLEYCNQRIDGIKELKLVNNGMRQVHLIKDEEDERTNNTTESHLVSPTHKMSRILNLDTSIQENDNIYLIKNPDDTIARNLDQLKMKTSKNDDMIQSTHNLLRLQKLDLLKNPYTCTSLPFSHEETSQCHSMQKPNTVDIVNTLRYDPLFIASKQNIMKFQNQVIASIELKKLYSIDSLKNDPLFIASGQDITRFKTKLAADKEIDRLQLLNLKDILEKNPSFIASGKDINKFKTIESIEDELESIQHINKIAAEEELNRLRLLDLKIILEKNPSFIASGKDINQFNTIKSIQDELIVIGLMNELQRNPLFITSKRDIKHFNTIDLLKNEKNRLKLINQLIDIPLFSSQNKLSIQDIIKSLPSTQDVLDQINIYEENLYE